ncbi:PREDICTED: APO protein 3, mitochondrial-like [Nicotiana attenuata]|uniref:Apo protein 3, mitochondrial n=1 Tax=Nicotiana attenuata TaxID=49451 RepID=A0A1J6J2I6_NICAT|nr:PREDICTED: APO protein 3, mitochondrial-like [Nicotiana attenuata]OIT01481.1 apo protein 3, mitochondrial [Nicotiana attenuata]
MSYRRVGSILNLCRNTIISNVKELDSVSPLYYSTGLEPLPRKLKRDERKPMVTSVNELKRKARLEKQERRVAREVPLKPPENGLLVKDLIPLAHQVLTSRGQLIACVSRISEEIPIYFCSVCSEVHVGHPPHKIRTCDVSGSQKNKEHTWKRGGVEHVLPVVESFHLYDRLGRAVSHNERLEVDRIPALVELCIQAGVDLPEYPTRRRKFPIYRVAGKLIDFEKRFPKDDLSGKDLETSKFRETIKKPDEDGKYFNLPYDDIKGFAMRGMEAWESMRTGAIQLMQTYAIQTCGYCHEVQVGPKGHRVRQCQAFKHQMRDGQHAWQEATIDDLLATVYVWHVRNPHAGDLLTDSLKRYYGKLPAVVELFSQAGAQVGDDYYCMMREDVAVPGFDEEKLVV